MNLMLCNSITEKEFNYLDLNKFEATIKLDGIRAIIKDKKIYNRELKDITYRYPEIAKNIPTNLYCDGEITCINFNQICKREHIQSNELIKLYSFLYPSKFNIFHFFNDDKEIIEDLCNNKFDNFKVIERFYNDDIKKLWEFAKKEKLEGIVLKRIGYEYINGRSDNWLKLKTFKEADITIIGYTENPAGITAISNNNDRIQVAGDQSHILKELLDSYKVAIIEIQYLEKTNNNRFRMPTFNKIKMETENGN